MPSELQSLYELQQIDSQIERVEKARAALDDGSSLRAEVEQMNARLKEERERLHQMEADYHDQDLKLKSIEAKRTQHRNKLFSGTITNPKELESLRQEVEMLTRNKGSAEEALLTLMDEIETQKQTTSKSEAETKQKQQELEAHVKDYQERLDRINSHLRELQWQRESTAGPIEETQLRRYDALRKKANNLAVVKVEGGGCPGCGVSLTSFALRRLHHGEQNVTCENCGRLLYFEE